MRVVLPTGRAKNVVKQARMVYCKSWQLSTSVIKLMDAAKKDKTRRGEISAECDEEIGHRSRMGAEDCTTFGGETKRSVEA